MHSFSLFVFTLLLVQPAKRHAHMFNDTIVSIDVCMSLQLIFDPCQLKGTLTKNKCSQYSRPTFEKLVL